MLLKKLAKYIFPYLPIRLRCAIQSMRSPGSIEIGVGSYIHRSVHVLGKSNVRVGSNSCVSEGSWLNVNHRIKGKTAIEIGNSCFIGKNNFFTSGHRIRIGDFTLTTIGCKFINSSHITDDPQVPYIFTGTTSVGDINIGVNCFIGAGATILGNVKIGHGSVVAANSFVLDDIPPFSLAVGSPARVIKRYNFSKKLWMPVSDVTSEDEEKMPSESLYLENLTVSYSHLEMPWIAAGRDMGDL